jgi:aspartyl aminopeptidase
MANRNIDTLDIGVGLLSMHAPYEIASKADIYETIRAFHAFLK